MPKVDWDETCSKCVYGSTEVRTSAKGRCTHKCPVVNQGPGGWVCETFTRRWETKEDLQKAREEKV